MSNNSGKHTHMFQMMTNVMTSSEREGLNGTKIAKVNEEVKKNWPQPDTDDAWDTDDIKQNNKKMKQYLITPKALIEDNIIFCFSSSGTIQYTK